MLPIVISVIVLVLQVTALPQNSCTTPDGKVGTCISLYKCPHIFRITEEQRPTEEQKLFARKSMCGFDINPLVCCNLDSTTTTTTTTTTAATTTATTTAAATTRATTTTTSKIIYRSYLSEIPDREHCGIQFSDKIFGGEETDFGEFPWVAALRYKDLQTGNLTFGCGGSLISPRYVLTAAHCLTGPILTSLGPLKQVILGDWNISSTEDCVDSGTLKRCATLSPTNADIDKVIPHEDYNPSDINSYNDIGLVKLLKDVEYTIYIQPICLPKYDEHSAVGKKLWVSGWGLTEKGKPSDVKLKVDVPVTDKEICAWKYKRASINLIESQICAGGKKLQDSCQGDSGGPLMTTVPDDDTRWYVEGIVSFGTSDCGKQGWSGIYTKVTSFLKWIHQTVG